MRTAWNPLLALSVGIACIASWTAEPASARRAAAPRCPQAHPAESDPCSREAQTCHYGGRREGDRSLECTCTRGDDDALRWRCIQMTAFE
ncbi:MAG: hypothetical protein ACK6CU_24045 [Deltaproteobacteria bacterium]|jgi:hypothetical protein